MLVAREQRSIVDLTLVMVTLHSFTLSELRIRQANRIRQAIRRWRRTRNADRDGDGEDTLRALSAREDNNIELLTRPTSECAIAAISGHLEISLARSSLAKWPHGSRRYINNWPFQHQHQHECESETLGEIVRRVASR